MTPGSSSNGGSMHQKQPPANVAFSYRASLACPPPARWIGNGYHGKQAQAINPSRIVRPMIFLNSQLTS